MTTMDENKVYFTWPDRVFRYHCRGCAECCKGLGIGLDGEGGQVRDLVTLYPSLTAFLRKRGRTWTAFNPRGGCWFLDQDGLCIVEREHTRQAKPASCRLFPFNRVFRLGSYTIVDYNSVICPLTAGSVAGSSETGSHTASHAEILAEIAGIADPAVVGVELPGEHGDGARLVSRERAIASACFAQAKSSEPDLAVAWRAQVKQGVPEQARARVSRAMELLCGQPWAAPSPTGLRLALWLTPSMRFNELYGPRDYDPRPEREKLLADMWLAWLGFVATAEKLSNGVIDMRDATSLWSEVAPLAYLAARWRHAPTMEPGPIELPGAADPDGTVERFARACLDNRKARKPLAELLTPLLEAKSPPDRVALARLLELLYRQIHWRQTHWRKARSSRSR